MNEKWKDIKNYEGHYQISNHGRVKSLSRWVINNNGVKRKLRERILKIKPHKRTGYVSVWLSMNSDKKLHSVHRLVAMHFLTPRPGADIVNHIDENPWNNNVGNLEWVTHAENLAHNGAFQRGRDKLKKRVYQYTLNNEFLRFYDCAGDTATKGFIPNAIAQVCNGFKKSHGGFIWRYS